MEEHISLNGKCFNELMATLSMVMDMEENIKLYHGWRVALFADRIGDVLGLDTKDLFYGGLLHDIGALGMEDHIVHRIMNGRYLDDPLIKAHPLKGARIINRLPGVERMVLYVEDHHERWDGQGYPRNKKGEEISNGGQVILAADLIDISLRQIKTGQTGKVLESFNRIRNYFIPDVFEATMEVLEDTPFVSNMADFSGLRHLIDARIHSGEGYFCPEGNQGEIFINVFADIIDAKHTYTGGHSRRVANYSMLIARALQLDPSSQENLYKAALLHDFGKVAVPKRILDAPRRLSAAEFNIVKQHPAHTIELLNSVSSLAFLAEAAGSHHERFDGEGYPKGLKGLDIPLYARIIAFGDSLDAMTSNRSYQDRRSFSEAARIIKEKSGTQFDPDITGSALEVIEALQKEKWTVENVQVRIR